MGFPWLQHLQDLIEWPSFTWSSAYFFGDFWTTGDMRWNRTYAVGRERTCMCELGNWAQKFGTSHSIYFAIGHRRHDILSIETNTTTPLGILNLLSFLYHKDPLSLFIILTGYSVSGQSEVLRAKSVAGGEKRNKDNWKQSWNRLQIQYVATTLKDVNWRHPPMNLFSAGRWRLGFKSKSPAQSSLQWSCMSVLKKKLVKVLVSPELHNIEKNANAVCVA